MADPIFNAHFGPAVASMMEAHGRPNAVSMTVNRQVVLEAADCIISPVSTEDEFSDSEELKVQRCTVRVTSDPDSDYKGLGDDYTSMVVDVMGERWGVERIDHSSDTFMAIELIRKIPRGRNRTEYYTE